MTRRPALREARHLHRADDEEPGIRRLRKGRGFTYRDRRGRPVDAATLDRIKRLAVPPAWTDVWICPDADGHIQATARDARGRKQYRYHPSYREARDRSKFRRMLEFSEGLPLLRERVDGELWLPTSIRLKGEGRAILFRKLNVDYFIEWLDYKRALG